MPNRIVAPGCPGFSPRHLLITAVALVLAMTLANGLYFDLRAALGQGQGSFLPGPKDRFADIVKVALSFKTVTGHLVESPVIETWPAIYRDYLLRNPYGDISNLAAGKLTHFHHPPLSQLLFTLAGIYIAVTGSPTSLLWICFGLYAWFVIALAQRLHPTNGGTDAPALVAVTLLCFASYPAMLVFLRGNYLAGYTSLLITLFLVDCLGRRQIGLASLVALAVAINLRPTATIFLLALPASLEPKQSLRMLLTVCLLATGMFLIALLAESTIYPDYSLASFLRGLEIYKEHYIFGRGGDGGNASLWALIKNGATISGAIFDYYPEELGRIFAAGSAFLLLVSMKKLLHPDRSEVCTAFILVSLYVLLAPVTAEYHLLVLISPLLILHIHGLESSRAGLWIVFLASALLLSPKNYVFVDDLSLQTILNPVVLLLALIMVPHETPKRESGREPPAQQANRK